MTATRFRVNRQVIHEVIEGEAVIIDLTTGSYYSLDSVGAQVWQLLQSAPTVDQIAAVLARDYDESPGSIERAVRELLDQLTDEGLVAPEQSDADAEQVVSVPTGTSGRQPFTAPQVTKFTDMQDLILLDPVHEVEPSAGWPLPADANRQQTSRNDA